MVKIVDILKVAKPSRRLYNCISSANADSSLPYSTLEEYIDHGGDLSAFKRIPNFGRKTEKELTTILEEFLAGGIQLQDSSTEDHRHSSKLRNENPDKRDLSILELVLSTSTSVRLQNSISAAYVERILPDEFANEAALTPTKLDRYKKIPNFGKNTLEELRTLLDRYRRGFLVVRPLPDKYPNKLLSSLALEVDESLAEKIEIAPVLLSDLAFYPELVKKRLGLDDEELNQLVHISAVDSPQDSDLAVNAAVSIAKFGLPDISLGLEDCVNEREWFVLKQRVKGITLEKLGKHLGITRERVRQIEKKSTNKIKKTESVRLALISDELNQILADQFGDIAVKDLPERLAPRSLADLVILNIAVDFCDPEAKVTKSAHVCLKTFSSEPDWDQEIESYLASASWPLELRCICESLVGIPEIYIEKYLVQKRKAEFDDIGRVQSIKTSNSEKATIALRKLGGIAKPEELSAEILDIFGQLIAPHAVAGQLQRMDTVLLVDRGTYALYESLNFSEARLQEIRDAAHSFLVDASTFINSRMLFERLNPQRTYPSLTHQALYGLLQDDSRFVTRRGLMVAAKKNSKALSSFLPLNEQVIEIVCEHGPITIAQIQKKIENRKILDVTIQMVLKDSPRILKIKPGYYQAREQVVGHLEPRLNLALKLAMNASENSAFSLQKKLSAVLGAENEVDLNKVVIASLLEKLPNARKHGDSYELTDYDVHIQNYLDSSKKLIEVGPESTRSSLQESFGPYKTEDLVNSDYRFYLDQKEEDESSSKHLDDLMSDFGF